MKTCSNSECKGYEELLKEGKCEICPIYIREQIDKISNEVDEGDFCLMRFIVTLNAKNRSFIRHLLASDVDDVHKINVLRKCFVNLTVKQAIILLNKFGK